MASQIRRSLMKRLIMMRRTGASSFSQMAFPPQGASTIHSLPTPKISPFWYGAAAVGAVGYWIFGGAPPATADKLQYSEDKTKTINVAYTISQKQGMKNMEDRYEVRQTEAGDLFAGLFDGHGGWQAASYISMYMSNILENELTNHRTDTPDEMKVALRSAFERCDRTLMHLSYFLISLGFPDYARMGATAIAMFIRGRDIYIANAGDCRAVLGKFDADGNMTSVPLSNDHNVRCPREMAALKAAHPGEQDIVVCPAPNVCYVKGKSQTTRTLGDAYLKCAEFNGRAGGRGAERRYVQAPYTPPYTTATPEVIHKALDSPDMQGAEFVVMGTDGLWDCLSNQQAVEIVERAIQDGLPEKASDRLIDKAMEIAAFDTGITPTQLKGIPPGKRRRVVHDDMTVLVAFIDDKYLPKSTSTSKCRKAEGAQLVRLEPKHEEVSLGLL